MDVNLISPEQEKQLLSAMTAVIEDVNGGTEANAALAKHANANGFGPEFTGRMVEAFNTSKTLHHLKSSSGEKRAASFPLADINTVISLMYTEDSGKTEKAAYVSYANPMAVNFNTNPARDFRADAIEKVAHVLKAEKAPVEQPIEMQMDKAISGGRDWLQKIANTRSELRMQMMFAKEAAQRAADTLAAQFTIPGGPGFNEVEYNVRGKYGDEFGKTAMDIVWGLKDFVRYGEKRASIAPDRQIHVMERDRTHNAAVKYIDALHKAAQATRDFEEFDREGTLVENHFKSGINAINKEAASTKEAGGVFKLEDLAGVKGADPQAGVGLLSDESITLDQAIAAANSPSASEIHRKNVPTVSGGGQDGMPPKKDDLKDVSSALGGGAFNLFDKMLPGDKPEVESLVTPKHEGMIRQLRVKVMLNDMISNDPVVSAYPPEDVFGAYNQIAAMVPDLSAEPILMRSLVARMLQSGNRLEAHEVSDLLRAEAARRSTRVLGY